MLRNTLLIAAVTTLVALPMTVDAQRYDDRTRFDDRTTATQRTTMDPRRAEPRSTDRRVVDQRYVEGERLGRVDRQAAQSGAFLNLTGIVTEAHRDGFVLDYGTGQVNVRMQDWDWYARGYRTLEGRQVTVRARADHDWTRRGLVDVDSVYSPHQHTYYYAPVAGRPHTAYISREIVEAVDQVADGDTWIRGTVAAIEPRRGVIRLDSGGVEFDVLTRRLAFDPITDTQPFRLEVGDRVLVAGDLISQTAGPVSDRRQQALDATALVLMAQDRRRMDANLARLDEW
jgi:hypothetical protein